jgi:DegV family protein with EDD domain
LTVRIVTDSACDLTDDVASALGIEIVPLKIRFGEREYVDRVELSVSQFYAEMATNPELPSTAAPSPGDFEAAFRKLADEGADEIVCINISFALSATGQAAESAARGVADVVPVTVVDSKSVSAGQGTLCRLAAQAAQRGDNAATITAELEGLVARTRVYGALDTLDNLRKGGRIGGARAMLGTMLSIKPCIDVSTGVVEEAGRQRTRKKAMGWLREVLAEANNPTEICVIQGDAPDIDDLLAVLTEVKPGDQLTVGQLGAVVGSHGGPRVIGLTFLVDD